MKNNLKKTSILSWKKSDYEKNGEDAPERMKTNPRKTEGEMMSDEEIEEWLTDSFKTLEILREENKDIFIKIYEGFISDLEYLNGLGRIEKDLIDYARDKDNFDFSNQDKED